MDRKRSLDKGSGAIPAEHTKSCSSTHRWQQLHNVTGEKRKRDQAPEIGPETVFAVRDHSDWRQPPTRL